MARPRLHRLVEVASTRPLLELDRLALTRIKINERGVDMTEERAVEAIVVSGVPGSGKTTFAHGLGQTAALGAVDLDTLTTRSSSTPAVSFWSMSSPGLNVRASINDIRYTCLFDTARRTWRSAST